MKKIIVSIFLLCLTNVTYTETAKQKLCRILGISPVNNPVNTKSEQQNVFSKIKIRLGLLKNPFICIPQKTSVFTTQTTRMTIPFNPKAQESFRSIIDRFFKRS